MVTKDMGGGGTPNATIDFAPSSTVVGNDIGNTPTQTHLDTTTSYSGKNKYIIPNKQPIVNAPFIKIDILCDDKLVSLSWKGNAPDYFTSLSHNRVLNEACYGVINLSYVPSPGEDPSLIETALWKAKGNFKYQYGITGYESPAYSGLIYNYTVTMSEGKLDYKLDFIGKEVSYLNNIIQNTHLNIPDKQGRAKKFPNWVADEWVGTIVSAIISGYMGNNYINYDDYYEQTYGEGEHFARGVQEADYELQDSELILVGLNPMQALQKIAEHLIPKDGSSNTFYYFIVDDETDAKYNKGKVKLIRTKNKQDTLTESYMFDWNHLNSTVLAWTPAYQGTAEIFSENRDENIVSKEVSELGIYGDGNYYAFASPNKATLRKNVQSQMEGVLEGSDFADITIINDEDLREYNEMAAYPYTATLKVLGLPTDKFIVGSHIQVNPYINGFLHHTSGEYMITSITDEVSSSGFTTDLGLVRIGYTKQEEIIEEVPDAIEEEPVQTDPIPSQGPGAGVGLTSGGGTVPAGSAPGGTTTTGAPIFFGPSTATMLPVIR